MGSLNFQDVIVWRKAHNWVLAIYAYVGRFPKHELFALGSQMRRAAVSVPANIAEGFKKKSRADKARFYNIAQGSLEESRYYLILSHDLGYGATTQLMEALDEVSRMLDAYLLATVSR
jgi:four helix bundle protein